MLIRLLIAIIVGVLVTFVADLFLPHTISVLLGVLAGLLTYFQNPNL